MLKLIYMYWEIVIQNNDAGLAKTNHSGKVREKRIFFTVDSCSEWPSMWSLIKAVKDIQIIYTFFGKDNYSFDPKKQILEKINNVLLMKRQT